MLRPLEPAPPPFTVRGRDVSIALAVASVLTLTLWPWFSQLSPSVTMLLWLHLLICVTGFVGGFRTGTRPIQTILFGFVLPYLALAPVYQLAHGQAAWGDPGILLNDNAVWWAQIIVTSSSLMLLIGMDRGAGSFAISGGRPAPARVRTNFGWLYLAGCLALTPRAVAANGGLAAMFSTRDDRADILVAQGLSLNQAGGAAVALVGTLPGALALTAAMLFVLRIQFSVVGRGLGKARIGDLCGLAVALGLVALYTNPFTNTRFIAASALGSVALLALRPRTPRAGRRLAAVVITGTFLAYPLANIFRYKGVRLAASPFDAFAGPDFDGFQQTVNGVVFYHDLGHSWGHYTLSALLYFVPRSIWQSKATPASIDVAEHRGYVFTNLSLPFPSEMAIEFGFLGMLLVLLVLGWLLGRLDAAWLLAPTSRAAAMAAYVSLAAVSAWRGPLGSNGPVYLTVIGLLFLALRQDSSRSHVSLTGDS